MFSPASVEEQYEQAAADDLKVLVVGGGIAGTTTAQLLRRAGRHPVLIERSEDAPAAGYMLALMPMVDAAIDDLGVRDRYRSASVSLERYAVYGHTGRKLREDSTSAIVSRFGDYRGIARGDLLDVLSGDGCPVTFGATVTEMALGPDAAEVEVSAARTRRRLDFDLVIVADGMRSPTRHLIGDHVDVVDSGWGGWVVWTSADPDTDLIEELWGAGFFAGSYPVKDRLGVFVGGPHADTRDGPRRFVGGMRRRLGTVHPRLDRVLDAIATEPAPYYWSLTDCRARTWTTDRTVLLGDAAAGFLPTAGVGAGMAMESAWLLSAMVSESGPSRLSDTVRAYERLQRPRVEAAHDNSRQLARLMFHRSRVLATARELAMRCVSVDRALRPIQRLLSEQPRIGERARRSGR
ncbi:FAD-dependent oxidoreductase [Mycobacterium deserti]|uniref:FAD-dependent monooxygenase n=1 Tax=Mycobacterium deserti TaxID=2978347 RepID=A0ABT2M3S2_9MYCO|nr:NAD(P)/FAD-dependent oxidoreductase [Mycobacterium deserti]MCT7656908.1 FAD-dependent monooxygenase [Mycobacterium deserti]